MKEDRRAWADIDLAALRANFAYAQQLAGARAVIAVVKADAYGHGAVAIARALVDAGCRRLAVVTVDEAVELRGAGIAGPLLVLGGPLNDEEADVAAAQALACVVHGREGLALVKAAAGRIDRPVSVQVEVDTGMKRMGVAATESVDLIAAVAGDERLHLEGVFTHFACADERPAESSLEQLARFDAVVREVRQRGIDPGLLHADNSAALLRGGEIATGLPASGAVRPGLMLYGAKAADHLDPQSRLCPVMSVRARVVAVRRVAAGEGIGYGATHRPAQATRTATLPIGYADGVLRALGNRGRVWLAGGLRSIVGRVSMDYVTVEIGDAAVGVGDVATFFGAPADPGTPTAGATPAAGARAPGVTSAGAAAARTMHASGAGPLRVEDVAADAGTLAYELLVRVGRRLPRILRNAVPDPGERSNA